MTEMDEQIRTWITQLNDSRLNGLQTKILLSSLEEIVDNGEVPSVIALKIKKVLLFGDINEYLDMQQHEHDFPHAESSLLGILKSSEYKNEVRLTDEEKAVVLNALKENFTQKKGLICEIFDSFLPSELRENSEEKLKKLIAFLKTTVNPCVVWDQYKEISTDVEKCYEELGKWQTILDNLIEMKLQAGEPLQSVQKNENLDAQATEAKSRILLGDMKKEFLSDEGAIALQTIRSKQKEEIEKKMLEIRRLKEEVSEYENLRSEGFFDLLKEYIDVTDKIKNKEKLKEYYFKGFEEVQKK